MAEMITTCIRVESDALKRAKWLAKTLPKAEGRRRGVSRLFEKLIYAADPKVVREPK